MKPVRKMSAKTKIKVLEVLEKAIAFLSGKAGAKRWCKEALARNKDGVSCDIAAKDKPVKFCAIGAILKFQPKRSLMDLWFELDEFVGLDEAGLSVVNDTKGRGAALRVMKSYKKKLEAGK